MKDGAACPIVAGTPAVIRAAFTKEIDFFQRAGAEYVNTPVTLLERNYFKRQMFEAWGGRLQVTEDESDFAVDAGFEALRRFDAEMQRRGMELLEQLERENRVGLVLLGRPYHNDPGLNHAVIEEFQALGYPVLSMRSIPKDEAWLRRFFREDMERKLIASPLDLRDVWPENYSTNSVEKVWTAKFAARHPNLGVLDLSSFKCGHDAPTYGLIDKIISATNAPYLALHDIDANKPGGSIRIRVKTYGYTLKLHEEKLQDKARKRSALERAVEEKRWELIRQRALALTQAREKVPEAQQEFVEMQAVFADYLARDPAVRDYVR
jgi:predicted nucleotide-binding protein (sugar kinase/HSP70/actin superfamily)